LAAVPSIGRAHGVEGSQAPEADFTRALYEQYANQIFRYCLHQLGSREEAEDAVQSTFLNAFRGIKRGIVPELESAWLFKIAHNVCLSRRRSSWRRGRIEAPTDFEVVEELAPAPSRRADELIGFQDVLEQMPEQQRRAILLREWQGLSYREISEELDLSQAAVETLIFRARRSLAQGLEQPVPLQERRRAGRRAAGALGNLLASAQSWLVGGGAAVKVAATVAVVGAGTVVATAPVQTHALVRHHRAPVGASKQSQAPAHESGTSGVGVAPPVSAGGVQHVTAPKRAAHVRHVPAAPSAPLVTLATHAAPAPETAPPPPAATPAVETPAPPAPAPPVAAPPATPPGQAKRSDNPPAAATLPPGQAKKTDAPPASAAQPHQPPGQAKKSHVQITPPPAVTTPDVQPAPLSVPPGQLKKAGEQPPAVETPPLPADPASGNGNGADNGRGKGKER
jgi:RNA polymerase sigma factor (sigma-70 family)